MVRQMLRRTKFWKVPSRSIGVYSIHEGRVASHLRRQRAEQVSNPLLMLDVNVKVTQHDDTALGPDIVFAAAKLTGCHVALHDVDAISLIEGDTAHLVKTNNVVLANETTLAGRVVYEHLCNRSLAAGNQMRVR